MRLYNVYVTDGKNVGDANCSPTLYFDFPCHIQKCDIKTFKECFNETFYLKHNPDVNKLVQENKIRSGYQHFISYGKKENRPFKFLPNNDGLIVGGGGLLYFRELELILKNNGGILISWGIGHNTHDTEDIKWPSYMKLFHLNGIRDYNTQWNWVPCVSCMSPLFDNEYSVRTDIIAYEHGDFPMGLNIPTKSNFNTDFETVIRFLGSATTVITNTYHGAYWATLLGKEVIVLEPFSTRFLSFKHSPAIAREYRKISSCNGVTYPEALEECRDANITYYHKVLDKIGIHDDQIGYLPKQ